MFTSKVSFAFHSSNMRSYQDENANKPERLYQVQ